MKFRVWRTVTTVQWTEIDADTAADAMTECEDNMHNQRWRTSSENDPTIQDIEETVDLDALIYDAPYEEQ